MVSRLKLSGSIFINKKAKIVIHDHARVNGGINYKHSGQRRVIQLLDYKVLWKILQILLWVFH